MKFMEKLFSAITFTILFILFGAYTSANASAPETFDDIKNIINQEFDNYVEIYELNESLNIETRSSYVSNETLKFDTKEELIEFIRELKENEPIIEKEESLITNNNSFRSNSINEVAQYKITPTIKNLKQPFALRVLVSYNYTPVGYITKFINSVGNVDSYSTVVAIADWTQRGSTVNINAAKSHANISVYGTWEYNAEVGSGLFTIPIGFRVSDSYNLVL